MRAAAAALAAISAALAGCAAQPGAREGPADAEVYRFRDIETRWASFENPTAGKGRAAAANRGAKGSAFAVLHAGESRTLLDVRGPGVVRRIWMTLFDKSARMLRGTRLDAYWDDAPTPAVSVPLGDFPSSSAATAA